MKHISRTALLLLTLVFTGCQTTPPPERSAFESIRPTSVLVLPPTNETLEVDASYIYLSIISQPIGESGYYVFPVAIVDQFMKENGLQDPYEMHQIPLDRLRQVFGADTVLKVNITDFGQQYVLLRSNTVVTANAQLIDLNTGQILWKGSAHASETSGDGGGGLAGMLVSAALEQVIDTLQDRVRDIARIANTRMIQSPNTGFIPGPYFPEENQSSISQSSTSQPVAIPQ